MKLPIYKLLIHDEDQWGVDFVALVDEPATQHNWMAFDKAKLAFQGDKEKRIVSGALMVAGMPIYRRDPQRGEFYVAFDGDTIAQIRNKFARDNAHANVNLDHDPERMVDGVYMIESFIIDSERGITTPKGFDHLPDGSWFGSYKVDNEEIWQKFIKTGEFRGFSVEGVFDMELLKTEDEELVDKLMDTLAGKRNDLDQIVTV